MADVLGTDLAVVPTFVAHDASALDLSRRRRAARGTLAPGAMEAFDLHVLTGSENLAQALILRLLTPVGSLAPLGHATYGSRLHQLIGQRKTDALRNLCRAFVLEVVAQEPRVEPKAVAVIFDPEQERPDSFVFTLVVQPAAGGDTLGVSLEVGI